MSQFQNPQPGDEIDAVDMYLATVLTAAMTGCVAKLQEQGVPMDHVVVAVARVVGGVLGSTVCVGDLAPVLRIRKAMTDEFGEAMRKVQPRPAPITNGNVQIPGMLRT